MEKDNEELKKLPVAPALLEEDDGFNITLGGIMSGELFGGLWMRRQVGFIALLVGLTVLYVTNRYSAEQELIEIADCKKELHDIKYRSLTRSSELTMRTRQSLIEQALRQSGDTTLLISNEPPFVIAATHADAK